MKNVIILNKFLVGGWTEEKNNIPYELIDLLKTDDNQHYVYNLKTGTSPNNVGINSKEYHAQYLVLTSDSIGRDGAFDILYVIELEKKMHEMHMNRVDGKLYISDTNKTQIDKILKDNNIKYGNHYVSEFHKNEEKPYGFYVTFKAKRIYWAPNKISFKPNQMQKCRNNFYYYDDKQTIDYQNLIGLISTSIKSGLLKVVNELDSIKTIGQSEYWKINSDWLNLSEQIIKFRNTLK